MDHITMLIPHEQLVETFLERFIKDVKGFMKVSVDHCLLKSIYS